MKINRIKPIKKILMISLVILLVISTIVISLGYATINNNVYLTKYLGIISGESQRLIKLELAGTQNDDLLNSIDDIINNDKLYNSVFLYSEILIDKIETMKDSWNYTIKPQILLNRVRPERSTLLLDSELFYFSSNDSLAYSEEITNDLIRFLRFSSLFLLLLNIIGVLLFNYLISLNEKKIEYIAFYDEMTKSPNKNKFILDAKEILKSDKKYSILILDVEKMKILNDKLGYQKGDTIIKIISSVLNNNMRENEVYSRNISDEFYVLLEFKNESLLNIRINGIYAQIKNEFSSKISSTYNLVLNGGVYEITDNEEPIEICIDKARHAHSAIKYKEGTSLFFYNEKMREKLLEENQIENEMYDAKSNEEFKVFLQPKYLIDGQKLCGAEALVRWQRNDNSMIFPNQFIPVFENNGFIRELDMYMLEHSCIIIKNWINEGLEPVPISVNFSRKNLDNIFFVNQIEEIVDKYNIDHDMIEIEITESTMLSNEESFKKVVLELQEKNFKLSMDDFGSGYSSLGLLKNFSFDIIKLDRSFFVEFSDIEKAKIVISNTIKMAKELNISTVAEGVEEKEQLDFLDELGCDIVQGYYFSKPILHEEFVKFMVKTA